MPARFPGVKMPRLKFTVVCILDDDSSEPGQIIVEHATATDWVHAVGVVRRRRKSDAVELLLVSVFPGHLRDLNECGSTSNLTDNP